MNVAARDRNGPRGLSGLSPATLMVAVLVAAGVAMRLLWLDRLTGIDGDEAWYGVLAQHWAGGDLLFWRTPSGNYPGPIQPALVAVGQWIAPSSFIMLRVPSVLTSLAAMALAWRIGARHFDGASARLMLLLVALLPADIAYARFGWDPSHGAMLALAAIATAIERRLVLTALLYALALWTHPTNVFLAPPLLVLFVRAEQEAGGELWSWRPLTLLGVAAAASVTMMVTASQSGQFASPAAILARLVSPGDWLAFGLLLARLIEGGPWFMHLAGSDFGALAPLADLIAVALLAGTLWFAIRSISARHLTHHGLPAAWLAMLVAYALIGGSAPLNPPTERYAFVLIAPTALVMALAIRSWIGAYPGGVREAAVEAALGAMLIAGTLAFYLIPLANRDRAAYAGWLGVEGLRTGPVEPKEAVARWLVDQPHAAPPRLVAADWWLYWPLAYRLAGRATVINAARDPVRTAQAAPGPTYLVAYAGSSLDARLAKTEQLRFSARGYDGRAVIHVWARPGAI